LMPRAWLDGPKGNEAKEKGVCFKVSALKMTPMRLRGVQVWEPTQLGIACVC